MSDAIYKLSLTGPADDDIVEILDWSESEFGTEAADRYETLIGQALIDITENPFRAGAKHRDELSENVFVYHLSYSLSRVKKPKVKTPRHFIVYRVADTHIEVLRILHDMRDIVRHVPINF